MLKLKNPAQQGKLQGTWGAKEKTGATSRERENEKRLTGNCCKIRTSE